MAMLGFNLAEMEIKGDRPVPEPITRMVTDRIVDRASARMREVLGAHEPGSEITMTVTVGPLGDVAFHSSHVKKS